MNNNDYKKGDRLRSTKSIASGGGILFPSGTIFVIEETPETDPHNLGGYYLRSEGTPKGHLGMRPNNMKQSFRRL